MSVIYDKYKRLKENDDSYLYLFKVGTFYIFLSDDADYINNYMVLKKTMFSKDVMKCGFPVSKIEDYLRVFKNLNLKVKIVENRCDIDKKIKELERMDLDNITPLKALEFLKEMKSSIGG